MSGADIPIFCRIIAIADVVDALTTERPYKKAWSTVDAVAEIIKSSGSHFDPEVVGAFLLILSDAIAIQAEFADMV